jgi:hypothetical protein
MQKRIAKRPTFLCITLLVAVFSIATFSCKPDQLAKAIEAVLGAPTPVFSLEGGRYGSDVTVEITCDLDGSVIYYTLDGSDPTTESTPYTEPIIIAGDGTTITLKVRSPSVDTVQVN